MTGKLLIGYIMDDFVCLMGGKMIQNINSIIRVEKGDNIVG
jgi:hypothetical protein